MFFTKIFFATLLLLTIMNGNHAMHQDLFTHDCANNLHFHSSNPLAQMGAGFWIVTLMEEVLTLMPDTAACHCPTLTQTELDTHLTANFDNILRVSELPVQATLPNFTDCDIELPLDGLLDALELDLDFNSTCTYSDYMNGDPCFFQLDFDRFQLQFTVQKCAGDGPTALPFFSLTGSGDFFADFGVPCETDADCQGTSECFTDEAFNSTSFSNDLAGALEFFGFFNENDTLSSGGNTYNGMNIGDLAQEHFWESVMSLLELPSLPNNMANGICGVNHLMNETYPNDVDASVLEFLVDNHFSEFDVYDADDDENRTYSKITMFPWDGVLDDGTNGNAASRMDGSAFPSILLDLPEVQDEVVMLYFGCDGKAGLNPNSPLGLQGKLPPLHSVLEEWYNLWSPIYEGRAAAEGVTLTDDDISYTNNLFDFGLILQAVTGEIEHTVSGAASARSIMDSDEEYSTILDALIDQLNGTMLMPDTCSADSWINEGRCVFEYDYIDELFTTGDISLRFTFEECSDYPHALPKFTLTCVGDICDDLLEPYIVDACGDDSDCPGTDTCTKIEDYPLGGGNFWAEILYGAETTLGYDYYVTLNDVYLREVSSLLSDGYNYTDSLYLWADNLTLDNYTEFVWSFLDGSLCVYYRDDDGSCQYPGFREGGIRSWMEIEVITSDLYIGESYGEFSFVIRPNRLDDEEYKVIDRIELGDYSFQYYVDELGEVFDNVISVSWHDYYEDESYIPCADGSYDTDGTGCVYDECASAINFHWDMFNIFRRATGQQESAVLADDIGFCQTLWETGLDTDNMDSWANDSLIEEGPDANGKEVYRLNGMITADYNQCNSCDGTCTNGVCADTNAASDYVASSSSGITGSSSSSLITTYDVDATIEITNIDIDSVDNTVEDAIAADIATSLGVDADQVVISSVTATDDGVSVDFEVVGLEDEEVLNDTIDALSNEEITFDELTDLDDEYYVDPNTEIESNVDDSTIDTTVNQEPWNFENSASSLSTIMSLIAISFSMIYLF